MRILIHSLNFSPELTGIGKYSGEMARWFAERGHEVCVVCAPPHYPKWEVFPEYAAWRYKREDFICKNLQVIRCPTWIPRVPRNWKRLLHLASFSFSSFPMMLRQVFWSPDIVLLVAPTMFCSLQPLCVTWLTGAVSWLHIQDFEVDAAFQLNDFSSAFLRRSAESIERFLMRRFNRVSTISERMIQRLSAKGVEESRTVLFPNWVDTSVIYPLEGDRKMRQELCIPKDAFVAMYSGSIGKKQGLDLLIAVVSMLANRSNIRFVFCVDGPGREALSELARRNENVTLLPLQPVERLNELLNVADVHLLPQLAGAADLVMPSKLTGMMASGRPVIATADKGTQVSIVLQNSGIVTSPGNVAEFANAIINLSENRNLCTAMGQKAREYAVRFMDRKQILSDIEFAMLNICLTTEQAIKRMDAENEGT